MNNYLPPHNNKMVWAVLCTVFCCLVGGIIAIVYSSRSNGIYNNALIASDPALQQSLYYESEKANKTAQTWITISIIAGILGATSGAIAWFSGAVANLPMA